MSNSTLPDKAGVIAFPPLLFISTLVVGLILSHFIPSFALPKSIAGSLGAVLSITGILIIRAAATNFVKRKTTVNPGGVTTTIVSDGVFKYTRNPMYLSLTFIYIGVSTMMNAWVGLLLLIPLLFIVQKGIIEREERYLERKFGEEYLNYKARVRRWI